MNCSCTTQDSKHCFVQSPHQAPEASVPEIPVVQKNKPSSCDWLLEIDNGSFFKNVMHCVFKKQHLWNFLVEFSCGIVGSLAIGQKETQDVLRNKWGKKGAMGINPILSKDEVFGHLNDTHQELLKQIMPRIQ